MPPGLLQFHGAETPDFCRAFGLPYMKAVRVGPEVDLLQYLRLFTTLRAGCSMRTGTICTAARARLSTGA